MSDGAPPKPRVNPNATIQIDLDQVELHDPGAMPTSDSTAPAPRRTTPPPLPPPLPVFTLPPPPLSAGKIVVYVAFFVVLIGLGIAGGLWVGMRARGGAAATSSTDVATVASAVPSVAPSASAPPATLTLPTIEMK